MNKYFVVKLLWHYIINYECAMALADLQVMLWNNDRAAPGDICTGVLAVAMRVIFLSHVLVGCTLSDMTQTTSTDVNLPLHCSKRTNTPFLLKQTFITGKVFK